MFKYVSLYCNVLLGVKDYMFALMSLLTFRVTFHFTPDYRGYLKDLADECWDRFAGFFTLGMVLPTIVLLGASHILEDVDLDVWYDGDPELGGVHKATVEACEERLGYRMIIAPLMFFSVLVSTVIAYAAIFIDLLYGLFGVAYFTDD